MELVDGQELSITLCPAPGGEVASKQGYLAYGGLGNRVPGREEPGQCDDVVDSQEGLHVVLRRRRRWVLGDPDAAIPGQHLPRGCAVAQARLSRRSLLSRQSLRSLVALRPLVTLGPLATLRPLVTLRPRVALGSRRSRLTLRPRGPYGQVVFVALALAGARGATVRR